MACGWRHCITIIGDGTVWTWGYNIDGQLGDGTTTDQNLASRVK
ncbi:MAG: hypothetical protein ACYTFG_16580 [Planctomycetota bacterium]